MVLSRTLIFTFKQIRKIESSVTRNGNCSIVWKRIIFKTLQVGFTLVDLYTEDHCKVSEVVYLAFYPVNALQAAGTQ